MEQIYRMMDWLDMDQAIDFLGKLTETSVGEKELLRLTLSDQCHSYIDGTSLRGSYMDDKDHDVAVIGRGYQLVVLYESLRAADNRFGPPIKHKFGLEGARYEPDPLNSEVAIRADYEYWEAITETENGISLYFKPDDIVDLAAKIKDVAAEILEVKELRSQLEHERASREQAEVELLKMRADDGSNTLEKMRLMLNHDHAEFSAMQQRAENAEAQVATTESLLIELRKQKQSDTLLIERMTERMGQHQRDKQSNQQTEMTAIGLTFPYVTKELGAMLAAALKYWSGYTSDKRQPTQKEVGYELCKLLGLPIQSTGEPARKAMILATAIKPDALPDA